jgi:two-component system alkaline phosphatase synthesis response regulator PhoP/two-component system response regulator VicR
MAKRILAADDETDIRLIVESLLKSSGYDVDTACDGEEAMTKFNQNRYDLVVLDIMMPKLDGYGVLKAIRDHGSKSMPVVMVTAKATDKDVWKGYEEGATYYITKPFINQAFLNIVNYLIGDLSPHEKERLETQL